MLAAERRLVGWSIAWFGHTRDDDPLAVVLEATARQAREAGLTDDQIDAELAAYNAERRQRA